MIVLSGAIIHPEIILFQSIFRNVQIGNKQSDGFHIHLWRHVCFLTCNSSEHFVCLFCCLCVRTFQRQIFWTLERWGTSFMIMLMKFGHNFWLKGPIDLRPTGLNCILQDHFRDTPLDHIWRAQICAKNAYLAIFGILGRVFEHIKYGQVGCPWKDLAKCCSDPLVLGQ